MILEAHKVDHVVATDQQIEELVSEPTDHMVESLKSAPVIYNGHELLMVVEGVAYPIVAVANRISI